MTNIWSFLLQSLTISLVAALLLLVKALLGDKLSPRWQYGIWGILALRIAVPVGLTGRVILLPLPLLIETVKAMSEQTLTSAYSSAYLPALPRFPIPWINSNPVSITDWLLVIYIMGVAASILWYIISYTRLRLLLRRGRPVSADMQKQLDDVCTKYGLKACPTVTVEGLPSAFVFGIIRPVLAIPADGVTDDKVLLHELLHLKHKDALQSTLWSVFRALHWCNPFLHYIFNRIGNDMEALCDQRVLERLEGEARRDYGAILLSMVNEHYPRAPGTTSLSNGGKNIARRIDAITRFKKYPKGMSLVSVCIAVVLLQSTIIGAQATVFTPSNVRPIGIWAFELAMASARTVRCSTVAGALDTYAKGVMLDNGFYVATASPLSAQKTLAGIMQADTLDEPMVYRLQGLLGGTLSRTSDAYKVYNLEMQDDGSYTAFLVFQMDSLIVDTQGNNLSDESGGYPSGVVWFPVCVAREDAWVVTRIGDTERMTYPDGVRTSYDWTFLPPQKVFAAEGVTGTVTVELRTAYSVNNMPQSAQNTVYLGSASPPFDETLKPDAQFTGRGEVVDATYIFGGSDEDLENLFGAGFMIATMTDADTMPTFQGASEDIFKSNQNVSGSHFSSAHEIVGTDWDKTVIVGGGGMTSGSTPIDILQPPAGYAAVIYWNGERQETLVLKAVTGNE